MKMLITGVARSRSPNGSTNATLPIAARRRRARGRVRPRARWPCRAGVSERLERWLLPRGQGVAVDVQYHRHDGVVTAGGDQVDHALLAEAVHHGLERHVRDGLVAEHLRAEV